MRTVIANRCPLICEPPQVPKPPVCWMARRHLTSRCSSPYSILLHRRILRSRHRRTMRPWNRMSRKAAALIRDGSSPSTLLQTRLRHPTRNHSRLRALAGAPWHRSGFARCRASQSHAKTYPASPDHRAERPYPPSPSGRRRIALRVRFLTSLPASNLQQSSSDLWHLAGVRAHVEP